MDSVINQILFKQRMVSSGVSPRLAADPATELGTLAE
jgi:hypothetical protein